MLRNQDWLTVGEIVGAQGLKGELRVLSRSEFPERFTKKGDRWIQKESEDPRKVQLVNGRQLPGKSIYIVKLEEIFNRTEAESIIGYKLVVMASSRPKLGEDEIHLLDLLDLEVRLSENGERIGKVIDLTKAGNDLITVKLDTGKDVLIPFVKTIVPEVNVLGGWLLINPPPGLLEL